MKQLKELWTEANKISNTLDLLEKAVHQLRRPDVPKGRETPFWANKRFWFERSDFSPKTFPLVHTAGRVTRVNRLTYSVFVVAEQTDPGDLGSPFTPNGLFQRFRMRSSPRGMVLRHSNNPRDTGGGGVTNGSRYLAVASSIFDFEWTFSLGSSESAYAQRRDVGNHGLGQSGPVYMSRNSLGNPDTGNSLLFSPKNPLVLKTNQFLSFTVRPTISYLALPGAVSFQDAQPLTWQGRFVVDITYAGYRTFGYDA